MSCGGRKALFNTIFLNATIGYVLILWNLFSSFILVVVVLVAAVMVAAGTNCLFFISHFFRLLFSHHHQLLFYIFIVFFVVVVVHIHNHSWAETNVYFALLNNIHYDNEPHKKSMSILLWIVFPHLGAFFLIFIFLFIFYC